MSSVDLGRPGPWTNLFPKALHLMEHLESQLEQPRWSFGGGTALMLRIAHRHSKDIDLFVPDPQYLGYINPRLSDTAESISHNYEEGAEFLKFFLPDGEIDVIVGTSLTDDPFDIVAYAGREIRVETCAEIIAKKMWHRGDRAKARDLYDLCAVAEAEPASIILASPFLKRHGASFLTQLHERMDLLEEEFAAIDAIGAQRDLAESLALAHEIIKPLLGKAAGGG